MLTISQIQELVEQNKCRLIAVGDISCDRMVIFIYFILYFY